MQGPAQEDLEFIVYTLKPAAFSVKNFIKYPWLVQIIAFTTHNLPNYLMQKTVELSYLNQLCVYISIWWWWSSYEIALITPN